MKKLIPAIVMLLVSAVVLSTASYAWFTTSTQATADGMSVTAEAPTSILIKKTGSSDDFGSSVDLTVYKNVDGEQVATSVELEPVSSVDGVNFFYPSTCEDYSGAVAYGSAINQFTPATAPTNAAPSTGYYLEYKIDLKNTGTSDVDLVLEAIELGLNKDPIMGAVRVAILDASGAAITGATGVYTADGYVADYVNVPTADNKYEDIAIGALGATGTVAHVVDNKNTDDTSDDTWTNVAAGKATTIRKTAHDGATPDVIVNIPAVNAEEGEDGVVSLVIRVWIEGQDIRCFAANSGGKADINLVFNTAGNVANP